MVVMRRPGQPPLALLWLLAILLPLVPALLEEKFVSFQDSSNSVAIHRAVIVYDANDPAGIHIAVRALGTDFEEITGSRPRNISWNGGDKPIGDEPDVNAIIVGTIDSKLVRGLVSNNKVVVSDIAKKWETFKTIIVDKPLPGVGRALLITGSDMRGTAFGVYTLAGQCGQSPYHFWADVPATKHDAIYALPKTTIHGEPSVKYRGLFINDEAPALTGWWSKYNHKEHQKLDSNFYRHVFDMMVRLKANFIWPGSWKAFVPEPGNIFFTDDPANIGLANDYGIVVSTSHHEPMQRATNEWNRGASGPWDWAENNEKVVKFMEEGVRRTGMNDSYYTLGMRGDADGPIAGNNPIGILRDVFNVQRGMLTKEYGSETAAKQVWTIYKEVATYYAGGLIPPDDVTLMFTDDNWGNIQRLPLKNETDRAGGVGLYFHLQYTGEPKAYKWHNTNNLAKVYKELYHALERGANRIWVINVADIKPMELPYNMIMDLAWNSTVVDFASIPDWVSAFITREFEGSSLKNDQLAEMASILVEHSRLTGRRKFESTQKQTYSALNFRENERVQHEWQELAARVSRLAQTLPDNDPHRATFFHYLEYPVEAGKLYMSIVLGTGLNNQWGRERRNNANNLSAKVLKDFDSDFDMIVRYDTLKGGKWAGIAAQPKHDEYDTLQSVGDGWWEPTTDAVSGLWYVQLRQNATSTFGNLGVYVDGSTSAQMQGRSLPSAARGGPTGGREKPVLPWMTPYGSQKWGIDVFGRGDYRVPIQWKIDPPEPWVLLNGNKGPLSGTISKDNPQQRVDVSIDWPSVPKDLNRRLEMRISFDTLPRFDNIQIPVLNMHPPADFVGFPASGGLVSIEAPHYQRTSGGGSSSSGVGFSHIPNLGTRSDSGSLALRPYKEARKDETKTKGAWAEYDFYLFSDVDSVKATIYITSGLDSDPLLLMQYSVLLDGMPQSETTEWQRVLGDPSTPGATPPHWHETVADQVWIRNANFNGIKAGKHALRWRVNSPEVYLEKIVLNAGVSLPGTYLGVPETKRVGS